MWTASFLLITYSEFFVVVVVVVVVVFAMLLTGVPLIFVAIGLGVQLDQYGTDE